MNIVVRCVLAGMLLFLGSGCTRETPRRVAAPPPAGGAEEPRVVQARWILDREPLRDATQRAQASPLVQAAAARLPADARLRPAPDRTAHIVGTLSDGTHARVTIIPFVSAEDPARAAFVTLMERDDRAVAQAVELLLGRSPVEGEAGFELAVLDGRKYWYRPAGAFEPGAGGAVRPAGQRTLNRDFVVCFLERSISICGAVVDGCRRYALPGSMVPCVGIGCGLGAAFAAVGCALSFFPKT